MKFPAGISDLFASERGCFAIFVTVIATVMMFMGKMTVDDWIAYTKWIAVALIVSKTVTSSITTLRGQPLPEAIARTVTTPESDPKPAA